VIMRTSMGELKILIAIVCFVLLPVSVDAQTFSSGSTGADGALDLSTLNCPINICQVQLPESGILNFTTVNIPLGKELRFKNNSRNTPVTLLAQGPITVAGSIDVSSVYIFGSGVCGGTFERLGPGGFRGALPSGFGPGGGTVNQQNGKWVGPLSLVPIVGGSGGWNIGDGGGAIVIASSSSITITGSVTASGSTFSSCGGPSGSGGAIRLVANSITISGILSACGFSNNCGVIRIEAPDGQRNFTGTATPAAVLSTINPIVLPSAAPLLTIASIGGFSVPSYSGSRFDTVDLLLPNQLSDPISIVITANNIPVGTQVEVRPVRNSSNATFNPGTLAGTSQNSTATATITGLDRTAVTYLLATAAFDPPITAQAFNPKGLNHVASVRIESGIGSKAKIIFLRSDGTEIEHTNLSKKFLEQFGL
jgi:hypothetical protein